MKNLFLVFLILISIDLLGQVKVDPSLDNIEVGLDYLVLFKSEEINTSKIKGKSKKGKYVFEKLKLESQIKQKQVIEYLSKNKIFHEQYIIANAVRVKSNKETLNWIKNQPYVDRIVRNAIISLERFWEDDLLTNRNPLPEWGIRMIGADSVWSLGYTGKGIIVGGQDTGYDWKVSPLKSKYRGFINDSTSNHSYAWHDAIKEKSPLSNDTLNPCGFSTKEPCDDHNHGTHTMGTMVGQDSSNFIGVAPDAKWIACRNMERGNGQLSTYLECFEWFLAPTDIEGKNPDVTKAPHVINNSWYCSKEEGCNIGNWEALNIAVKNLKAAGIVVVVSAGNSGPNCNTVAYPPALFSSSFSVGATNDKDTIANFSSRGNVSVDSSFRIKPDVSAPGRSVRSVIRGGGYATYSGTSMAGPHVAGAVALIIEANPQLSGEVEAIEKILQETAVPKTTLQECGGIPGDSIPNNTFGFGRIDALKAVEKAIETIVNVQDEQSDEFLVSIHPNPFLDYVSIETKSELNFEVFLFDSQGRRLFTRKGLGTLSLDLSNLIKGTYLIQVVSNNFIQNKLLVKL